MNTRITLRKRLRSLVLLSTLLIQQFVSLAVLFPFLPASQVAAAEDAQVDVSYDAGESMLSFTVEPADRVSYDFVYITAEETQEALHGEREATDKKAIAELYLGTCSEDVCTPHTVKSGELKLTIESEDRIQEKSVSFTTVHDVLWLKEGETFTTTSPVELDKEYKAPQNDKVVLKFTTLPEQRGTISFTEIKLSQTQQSLLKAVSDTAYDITSDMENGTFAYTLALPLPEDASENIAVKVAETPTLQDMQDGDVVEGDGLALNSEDSSIEVKTLDHFTTFVIVDTTPITLSSQVVTPSSTNWTSAQQNNAAGTFTFGPGGAGSVGVGSYKMKLGATGGNKTFLGAPNVYNGQPLADLNALSYSFYVVSPGEPVSTAAAHLAPVVNIALDLNNDGIFDGTLVYEPCYADPLNCGVDFRDNTWHVADAMTGKGWWYTKDNSPQYETLAHYLARLDFADATLLDPANNQSALQFVAGQNSAGGPWNEYFEAHIDNISIGFDSTSDTFDFEPGELAAPLFWVEEQTARVELAWESVPAATGYNIYRASAAAGPFTQVNATPVIGNSYSDTTVTAHSNYYYKVTAKSAHLESVLDDIIPKHAGTLDIVIDDDSWQADQGASGIVTVGGTGSWDKYAVQPGAGINSDHPSVLEHATGGDTYSTGPSATGQSYSWAAAAALNGSYEVFVNYICDPQRGDARYRIYSDATQLGSDVIRNQALLANGNACASQSSGNTESEWVSLGSFDFTGQARVEVIADPGQAFILADAVGFRLLPPTSDLTVCKEDTNDALQDGWRMIVSEDSQEHVFTTAEVQNRNGYTFPSLPAGEYVVEVNGYYRYGNTADMIADAGYSHRRKSLPCSDLPGQPNPWVSGASSCFNNSLSVHINDTLPDWGAFNPDHAYQTMITHTGGALKFNITDNSYGDNRNTAPSTTDPLRVRVSAVTHAGITGSDNEPGCVTFTDLPDGNYTLLEEMQSGWRRAAADSDDTVPANGQVTLSDDATFTFVNSPLAFQVTGMKFNDENDNGIHDNEPGLPNWEIQAAKHVETVSVDSRQMSGTDTSASLPAGQYYLKVSGTWQGSSDPNGRVDAEYVTSDLWANYSDGPAGYGENQGDLLVNDTPVDWGAYDGTAHTYYLIFDHTGGNLNLSVFDGYVDTMTKEAGWYGDNSGSLIVDVYQVIATTTTDSTGNYTLDVPAGTGEVIVYEVQQPGWKQTAPATVFCTVSSSQPARCDFGNTKIVEEQPTPSPSPVLETPSPIASPSDAPSPAATPSATPAASVMPTPEPTPVPTPEPTPVASPAPVFESRSSSTNSGGGGTGPVTNNAMPPVCSANTPSGAPSVTITNSGENTVTLSWTGVDPVTHYGLIFQRNSDGAEYGATNIGNVNSYTITNLSGDSSYTFEVFGINDCAPGPRGQATSSTVGGPILTGRPTGDDGQVLGENTESPSPSASPDASPTSDASTSPEVLGTTDAACTDFAWWWAPIIMYAVVVVVMAFVQNNNPLPRRIVTAVGFGVTALILWYWKCQPWMWVVGTGVGGAVVELFTTFLLSDDEEEIPPKPATT